MVNGKKKDANIRGIWIKAYGNSLHEMCNFFINLKCFCPNFISKRGEGEVLPAGEEDGISKDTEGEIAPSTQGIRDSLLLPKRKVTFLNV